jgi:hypothetical protein
VRVIIRATGDELLLIKQVDHAALAERIVAAWRLGGLPQSPRHDEILFATRRHDDGWIDEDSAPLVDPATGELLDYVHAPDDTRRGIWPRGVERLSAFPYVAALVAQHALHLFERYRDDPDWLAFFERMERLRAVNLTGALPPRTEGDLRDDYFFVRMADLLSLQFCDDWREPQRHGDFESRWDGARLTIAPDPFEGATVPMTVTARRVKRARFDARAAADAFADAELVTIRGLAAGAAAP